MAAQVAGELYESITGQLFEIGRQLRQPNGYPFSPEELKVALQYAIEGRFNGAVPQIKKLLQFVTTVSVGAYKSCKASDHLKVDTKGELRIAWIGDNLKANFLGLSEGACEPTELKVNKLTEDSLDALIIAELDDKCEIRFGQFLNLLRKQGKGQKGALLNNGWANIAYIRDINGILWAVRARWASDDGGWSVDASSVERPDRWGGGRRVVSR